MLSPAAWVADRKNIVCRLWLYGKRREERKTFQSCNINNGKKGRKYWSIDKQIFKFLALAATAFNVPPLFWALALIPSKYNKFFNKNQINKWNLPFCDLNTLPIDSRRCGRVKEANLNIGKPQKAETYSMDSHTNGSLSAQSAEWTEGRQNIRRRWKGKICKYLKSIQ